MSFGNTVMPRPAFRRVCGAIEGRGMDNSWNWQAQVSDTTNMIVIPCIVEEFQADNVVDVILSAVRDRIGFLTISDVYYVVRPQRFRI
jgi:hypothetical protein